MNSLRGDVDALCALGPRDSAGAGERRSAEWIAERLRALGAADVQLSSFRYQRTFAWAQGLHAAAGLVAAALGSRVLSLAALVSYELDFHGRSQWTRRFLPAGEGTNVTARIPASAQRRRTVVLVAHHDAANTGLIWNPRLDTGPRDRIPPYTLPAEAAFGLVGLGFRRAGAALLALLLGLLADQARGQTVPGASDNATGVAAVLALLERFRRDPLPDIELIAVFPGCEESGMGGMAHWMRTEGRLLDPETTLVIGLDTLGAGEPVVLEQEGRERYREPDLRRATGMRRFRIGGWTDPVLAKHAGLPAVSIVSVKDGRFTNYHLPSDVPANVDWESVERCVAAAESIVKRS